MFCDQTTKNWKFGGYRDWQAQQAATAARWRNLLSCSSGFSVNNPFP
jgi:hypothetical protein